MEEEEDIELEKDMTPKLIKDLGRRYPAEKSKQKKRYGLYECQYCGKEFEAMTCHIKSGDTKSCGCQRNRDKIKHGNIKHRLYNIWKNMLNRCYNVKDIAYQNYGGRGIIVCERWHYSFNSFIEDMFPSFEEGLTLDRIDVDGNYELENCRWASRVLQAQNTRKLRSNNTSGFRGVSWDKNRNKYVAQIKIQDAPIFLGRFINPEQGALAYDTYIRENNLEHTKNFSDEDYFKILEDIK